jgi:hypothetical protein
VDAAVPAWSAIASSVFHDSTTGLAGVTSGSIFELPAGRVTLALKLSVPKNWLITARPAALNVLWPETYSGNPGVTTLSAWYGSQRSPGTLP